MASKKISDLDALTPLLTDLVPLDRPTTGAGAPVTGQASLADIQALIDTGGAGGDQYWTSNLTTDLIETTGSIIHDAAGNSLTNGNKSVVFGASNTGDGAYIFLHGESNTATGQASHAEGEGTTASGDASHAEGRYTIASGKGSHAEGEGTTASGDYSHAEGFTTTASGSYSHAEGSYTIADGLSSHAEGWGSATQLRGFTVVYVDSDGVDPTNGVFQLDSVYGDITTDIQNAANYTTLMVTDGDTTGGFKNDRRVYDFVGTNFESPSTWITCSNLYGMSPQTAIPYAGSIIASFAPLEWQLSNFTTPPDQAITGTISHAEGIQSISIGSGSHAEGKRTLAIGVSKDIQFNNDPFELTYGAHSEGFETIAYGNYSHAEGAGSISIGDGSHAEGDYTIASGSYSHAEGTSTTASGDYSHAEGDSAAALGQSSHAEGFTTTASGDRSHAEGTGTTASGDGSHAEGLYTIASGSYQHVQGKYNLRNNDFSIFVIGDGNGDADANRSDIVRVNSGTLPGTGRLEVTGSLGVTIGMTGSLSYTPADGSHWSDPDPTNVKEALDRMASLLYTLNSNTPIP